MFLRILTANLLLTVATLWAAMHTTDSLDTVKKALADGKAILLDVREKAEWDAGRLEVARLLSLSELSPETVAKVVPKDKIIYVHCAAGVRCLRAGDVLQKLGYDVRPLKPGYKDLLKAGFKPATK